MVAFNSLILIGGTIIPKKTLNTMLNNNFLYTGVEGYRNSYETVIFSIADIKSFLEKGFTKNLSTPA